MIAGSLSEISSARKSLVRFDSLISSATKRPPTGADPPTGAGPLWPQASLKILCRSRSSMSVSNLLEILANKDESPIIVFGLESPII
jgi:hypothetical protein